MKVLGRNGLFVAPRVDRVLNQEQGAAKAAPMEVKDVMGSQPIIRHAIPLAAVNYFIFEKVAKIIHYTY